MRNYLERQQRAIDMDQSRRWWAANGPQTTKGALIEQAGGKLPSTQTAAAATTPAPKAAAAKPATAPNSSLPETAATDDLTGILKKSLAAVKRAKAQAAKRVSN